MSGFCFDGRFSVTGPIFGRVPRVDIVLYGYHGSGQTGRKFCNTLVSEEGMYDTDMVTSCVFLSRP